MSLAPAFRDGKRAAWEAPVVLDTTNVAPNGYGWHRLRTEIYQSNLISAPKSIVVHNAAVLGSVCDKQQMARGSCILMTDGFIKHTAPGCSWLKARTEPRASS